MPLKEAHFRIAKNNRANIQWRTGMAIFHLHAKHVSRGKGQTLASKSAYNAGERIRCPYTDRIYNRTVRQDVSYQTILLPANANPDLRERQSLIRAIESAEKRHDARLAVDIEMSLPIELTAAENLSLIRKFAKRMFVDRGLTVDLCVHKLLKQNPHCHMLIATRAIDTNGEFVRTKDRSRESKHWIVELRQAWACAVNMALEQAGHPQRISHRSHQDRQIKFLPTIHVGPCCATSPNNAVARRRKAHNDRVKAFNQALQQSQNMRQVANQAVVAKINRASTPQRTEINPSNALQQTEPSSTTHSINPANTSNLNQIASKVVSKNKGLGINSKSECLEIWSDKLVDQIENNSDDRKHELDDDGGDNYAPSM